MEEMSKFEMSDRLDKFYVNLFDNTKMNLREVVKLCFDKKKIVLIFDCVLAFICSFGRHVFFHGANIIATVGKELGLIHVETF